MFNLKKLVYFSSVQTQRDGLIFIYDMTNSSYGNFDYELCVKILNLLKVNTWTFSVKKPLSEMLFFYNCFVFLFNILIS